VAADLEHAVRVAQRQAFGRHFETTPNDRGLVDDVVAGKVILPPHPTAEISMPVDWTMNPFRQRSWVSQFHMLRWLDPFRRLAMLGDTAYFAHWERLARSWTVSNSPSAAGEHGNDSWAAMVAATRAQALLLGLPYVDDPSWLLDTLSVHGAWLAEPANLGRADHALHQHAALLMLGSALGRADWTGIARARIGEHVEAAFDDEGVNAEASLAHWLFNYQWTLDLARRCELEGIDASAVVRRIRSTPQTLAHATRPDGRLEAIGETGANIHLRGMDAPELLYIATEGADGRPPESVSVVYRAGYAFGRSGWGETERQLREETYYSLRFGHARGLHGHQDGGAVTYWAQGVPFLVDAGKHGHLKGAFRDYAAGRLGHNVLHVQGREYDPDSFVELVSHRSSATHEYYRLRDGGYRDVVVDRQVVYSRATEGILVVDTVRADEDVTVEQRWHLGPGVDATMGRGSVLLDREGKTLSIAWGGSAPQVEVAHGGESPLDGWLSAGPGLTVPTTVIKARRRGERFRIITGIFPASEGMGRVEVQPLESGGTAFVVHGHGRQDRIVLGNGTEPARDGTSSRPRPRKRQVGDDGHDVATIEAAENHHTAARHVGGRGPDAHLDQTDVDRITSGLRLGIDYGGGALLRDAGHYLTDDVKGLVDARTRVALLSGTRGPDAPRPVRGARVHVYDGVPRRLDLRSPRSVHVVNVGPLALPARVHLADSSDLVVVLHGALNRLKTELPRFERIRSLGELGVNVMAVADPTLDLDPSLTLGWYLGSRNVDLAPVVGQIVNRFVDQQAISRVVLVGSSGGGFAAMATALYVPGSSAVVMSPQTDIRSYHPSYSRRALTQVFGSGELRPEDIQRISLAGRYATHDGSPRLRYYINRGDTHHLRDHAEPFWEFLRTQRPDVPLSVDYLDLGNGHISPDAAAVNEFVSQAFSDA